MKILETISGVILAFALVGIANADVIYSNPYSPFGEGNCIFSTTCAALQNPTYNIYAGQEFTITNAAVISNASFVELDDGVTPTGVNWGFWTADGHEGLPGTLLFSGFDTVSSSFSIGSTPAYPSSPSRNLSQVNFGIGSVSLSPGTYYFAVQAISPTFFTFLSLGIASSGAVTTYDGGADWQLYYAQAYPSVAVSLSGPSAVPEPATWAYMIAGLGGLGLVFRDLRRRKLGVIDGRARLRT